MPWRRPDIRKLARRQRWLMWVLLAGFLLQFSLPCWVQLSMGLPALLIAYALTIFGLWIAAIVAVVLVLISGGSHPVITAVCAILMLVPLVNLVTLLFIDWSVNRTLRRAGLHVGFTGVRDEVVDRTLDPMLCSGCGYNLTGNVSGICPECGRPVGSLFCAACRQFVTGVPQGLCPVCGRALA